MNKAKKIINWGFIIGLVSLILAGIVYYDSGKNGAKEDVWQDGQSKLLETLINEIKVTRNELIELKKVSSKHLKNSEYSNQVSDNIVKLLEAVASDSVEASLKLERPNKEEIEQAINTEISTIEDEILTVVDPAIDRIGWIYIGKLNDDGTLNTNYTSTIKADKNTVVDTGHSLTISTSVGFNDFYPTFPRYETGLSRIYPHSLESGTKVSILKLEKKVGLRNFTWAKVQVSSIP